MEGTRKWASGLCSPSEPPAPAGRPEESSPWNRVSPTTLAWQLGPQCPRPPAGLVGSPGGSRGGAGQQQGARPVSHAPRWPRVKACSQLPGTQQTSQVPAAHMAQQGLSCEPRASGRQAGVCADIPLLRGAQSLRLAAGKGMRVPSQGSAPRAGSSSTPELR